ncbi:MAG: choice-of-anchor L domain-containing protein [Polyangiaceae bacterium]|nr:choice-of-anchor L domain-containing protein [Polyangiaceae bacterium]
MDRTLLLSGSLVVLVGALGVVSGCEDTTTGTTTGTGGSAGTGGEAGTGGTAGAGGTGGIAGAGGTGGGGMGGTGGIAGAGGTGGGGMGGTGGIAGAGGTGGGMGGAGGTGGAMGGAGGVGGTGGGGMGGAGGGMSAMACKVCDPKGGCLETCIPDKPDDMDCDGWTPAEGDCCDNCFKCGTPGSVNPGAFEYLGNVIDDDCDPATLDNMPPTDCTDPPLATPTSTIELVKAIDLCKFTSENPPLPQKKWGVISSSLLLADGTNAMVPKDLQVGVLAEYGPYVKPIKGTTIAALSTGTARDETDPGHVYPQNGPNSAVQKGNYDAGTAVPIPADYLAANGGKLPSPAACPECSGPNCTTAFDSVNFKMRIRVPTNARSFSYRLKSYSAEYPEYTCQQFNDFFIARLLTGWVPDPNGDPMDPKNQPLPADRNIAFDTFKNPISVNNAFYDVCFPYLGAPPTACSSGTLELVGTGMGGWNGDLKDGGGTVWLTNEANVVPGETIEIEFIIFDAGDHNVDSIVLLDYFRWGLQPTEAGVHK